ncbi:hypothetical protein CVT25_003845 [Psilocybe cyanescens]|uniref:Uncharacterized protein n=1 Tax=Psilocybe cyanescens TaxID=93625 RepID=A0A409WXZ8_PSICY|nr:hypothetical protein CVT25_003845 [Psilocybe cyanescens]
MQHLQHLVRSKPGSEWNFVDLEVRNILVQDVDAATFFGLPNGELPALTAVSPAVLNVPEIEILQESDMPDSAQISKEDHVFFKYLRRVGLYRFGKEAGNDLIRHVLKMLDFDDGERLITTGREMILEVCGTRVSAKADTDVWDGYAHSLLVQCEEYSALINEPNEPLIAAAIAAFSENNYFHLYKPRSLWTFYGIALTGSAPFFYKIPVTEDLVNDVVSGKYPAEPVIVQRLVPPVQDQRHYHQQGMMPVENRRIVFQCLEALRGVLSLHYMIFWF